MAHIKSGTVGTEAPLLAYQLYAEQTAGSGNSRTIKITVNFKVNGSSASWYGFPAQWRPIVNGVYGSWATIKGTESWNGGESYRAFSQSLTVDVGTTSSKSISVGFQSDSYSGDNGWDGTITGTFTVGATNVAPTISGTVTTSPSGTISEKTASITITAPTASDGNGNLSGYRCRVSINGGGNTEIYRGSSRSFTHNVSSYGEGTTFKYTFDAYDSAGAWSGVVYSAVVTKNRFTQDTLSSSSSIAYSTSSIAFSFSGASNTSGNTTFTKTLSCDGITVYNPTVSGTSATVTIYKSGTAPSTPYIKFDDIKNKFASASYKGTLNFTLSTKNTYGTTKTSSKAISVNIQTTPNAVGSCNIATNANSTAYKTVKTGDGTTSASYFIPDSGRVVRVDWTAGSGKLGEAVVYDLYVAYGSGSWQLVTSNLTALYYNHSVPKQTASQQIKYKVRTKCSYNSSLYADRDTAAQTLHYYSGIGLTQGTITRGATTVDVVVTVKTNTSITNVTTVGNAILYNKGTTTQVGSTVTLSTSQVAQTLKFTGLTDEGQYDLKITYNDITGLTTTNLVTTIAIGANSPLFFVNKYGVGVNGLKATSSLALNVKGSIGIQDPNGTCKSGGIYTYTGDVNGMGMAIQSGGAMVIGAGESPKAMFDSVGISKTGEHLYLTADSGVYFASNCNTIADRKMGLYTTGGNFHIPGAFYEASNAGTGGTTYTRVYSPNNKPTPTDLGVYSKINNTSYWGLGVNGSEDLFLRTPASGLIPNVSNGASGNGGSSLGTTGWRFASVWATQVNAEKFKIPSATYGVIGKDGTDIYISNEDNNYLRLKQGLVLQYGGQNVHHAGWCGIVNKDLPRVTNLNTIYVSGWHSWSTGTTGAPTTYGVVITLIWGTAGSSTADRYQIAMGSNAVTYCRQYVNSAWGSWRTI